MPDMTCVYKVAVLEYFATGEGQTVIIVSGTDETIESEINEFFRQGMTCMPPQEWLEESKQGNASPHQHEISVIKHFAPILWSKIEEHEQVSCECCSFSMRYHTNYA